MNACQEQLVGSRRAKRHHFRYFLQRPMGFRVAVMQSLATPTCTCYFFQCRGRVTPLPSLFSISTSKPNEATRGWERMLSGPRCSPARGNIAMKPRDAPAAGYSHCFLHIYPASLPPFMMHHSCISKNGSTPRGKH